MRLLERILRRPSNPGLISLVLTSLAAGPLASQERSGARDWNASVGALALVLPRYPGSDQHRLLPVPLLELSYRDRAELGPSKNGIGIVSLRAFPVRSARLDLAVEAIGLPDRPASRADALAGMQNRDLAAAFGLSAAYRVGSVEAVLGVSRGVNDGTGLHAVTRVTHSRWLGPVLAIGGVSAVLADGRQMRREFGVTAAEADSRLALYLSGDPRLQEDDLGAYRPPGGLRHVGASLAVMYPVSGRWFILGFGGAERLAGRAAASPLVSQRTQLSFGLGLTWQP